MRFFIIAYLIWKGSYNYHPSPAPSTTIIAYLIWKGSYNNPSRSCHNFKIIAYLIWKGSYNLVDDLPMSYDEL